MSVQSSVSHGLGALGIVRDGRTFEDYGGASFDGSFPHVLGRLDAVPRHLDRR